MAQIRFLSGGKVYEVWTDGNIPALIMLTDEERSMLRDSESDQCMMLLPKHTDTDQELQEMMDKLNGQEVTQIRT